MVKALEPIYRIERAPTGRTKCRGGQCTWRQTIRKGEWKLVEVARYRAGRSTQMSYCIECAARIPRLAAALRRAQSLRTSDL